MSFYLDELADELHRRARAKGFYDRERIPFPAPGGGDGWVENPSLASEKLLLIVTEVSEAMDARRDDDRVLEAEEVADVIIRALDYAAWRGFSMDAEVVAKMAKNVARPELHGRSF